MELSIDTASELASVALSSEGRIEAEMTWRCHRNHTVELLPTIEELLAQAGITKEALTAIFVCIGPGMYTGLRVGISTAKGLARALLLPIVGVGRLELDAYPHAAFPGTIVAVHKAGRGEIAWAAYSGGPWRETSPPRLSKPEELPAQMESDTLLVGETDEVVALGLGGAAGTPTVVAGRSASVRRAATLAELGYRRLEEGRNEDVGLLRPVYLRPPVIGQQRKSGD